jgi:hypothetical protein
LLFGLGTVLFAAGAFAALPRSGFVVFLLVGGVLQSLNYFAAVALALLAERDVRSRQEESALSSPELEKSNDTITRVRSVSKVQG